MAANPNAAYMLWRQFSGEAKAPVHMNLRTPGVAAQQADVRAGPTMGDQLRGFAQAAGDFFQAHQGMQKAQKVEADSRVTDWMARHTMAEYRQKMKEGNVPFQNDPVAMDILHNNAAYGVALEVEEAIQNKVKEGVFKTTEEADKARIDALEGARAEYSLSMGISPDNKAFQTGFNRDEEKRRQLLVGLQTDVTDKFLRTQAKVSAQSAILSPLTDDFVKAAAPATTAGYIVNSIKQQQVLGQIRSDQDVVEMYAKTVESLKGLAGGSAALKALGDQEVELYGSKGKLRDHLGGGVFDAAVIGAMDREQQLDGARQGGLNVKLISLQRNNDVGGLVGLRGSLMEESGGKMTRDIQTVDQALKATEAKMARENAAAIEQHTKNQEKQSRLFAGMATMRQFLSGDLDAVSPDGKDLGFKDDAESREAEQMLLASIEDPQEELKASLKLAGWRKDGFAANALKSKEDRAGASWEQFMHKLGRGDATATVPDNVVAMQKLYESDPEAFTLAFKDPAYITALEVGKMTGSSPADVARAQVEWKKLPTETKKVAEKELTLQLNRVGGFNAPYVNDALKSLSSHYLAMGIAPDRAVRLGREQFDRQTVKVLESPIHKGFFSITGDPKSFEWGKSTFDAMLPEVRLGLGNPSASNTALSYDRNNQTVKVHNLQTGEARTITQDDLKAQAQKTAAEAEAKAKEKLNKAIKVESRQAEIRKINKASETDIIQSANPAWNN